LLGWLAIKYAWPHKLQKFAEENTTGEEGG